MKDLLKVYNQEYFRKVRPYARKKRRLLRAYAIITKCFDPKSVLEVGCGEGHLVKLMLDRGIEATGMDISPDAGMLIRDNFVVSDARLPFPFPDKSFDLVLSRDFFEHVEEELIDQVYNEMKRVGKNVTALISFKKGEGHLTVEDHDWWSAKLPGCLVWNNQTGRE